MHFQVCATPEWLSGLMPGPPRAVSEKLRRERESKGKRVRERDGVAEVRGWHTAPSIVAATAIARAKVG